MFIFLWDCTRELPSRPDPGWWALSTLVSSDSPHTWPVSPPPLQICPSPGGQWMGPWRTVELTDSSTQLPLFVVQFPTSKHFFLNQKHQSQYDSPPKILWAFLMKCHLKAIFTLVRTSGTFMNRTLIYDTYKHNIIFLQLFHFFFLVQYLCSKNFGGKHMVSSGFWGNTWTGG